MAFSTMRSDLLSQRFFGIGCLGLPWLWTVHALYWKGLKEGEEPDEQEGLLNPDDRTFFFWKRSCFLLESPSHALYRLSGRCHQSDDRGDSTKSWGLGPEMYPRLGGGLHAVGGVDRLLASLSRPAPSFLVHVQQRRPHFDGMVTCKTLIYLYDKA